VVERANQFLEISFLPGQVFASSEDFNTQLGQWLPKANARLVRRTGARPSDLLAADLAAMLTLPPVPPVTRFTAQARLPRDYYVETTAQSGLRGVPFALVPTLGAQSLGLLSRLPGSLAPG
jgi:hypothetical protein